MLWDLITYMPTVNSGNLAALTESSELSLPDEDFPQM